MNANWTLVMRDENDTIRVLKIGTEKECCDELAFITNNIRSAGYYGENVSDEYYLHVQFNHSCRDVIPLHYYLIREH